MTDLSGKEVIVTGGNVGIGRPTALELARMGASVTIIGRNEATCSEAVSEIVDSTGNQKVEYAIVDLGSFSAIRTFCTQYTTAHSRLDILVNNAGVVHPPFTTTEQGFEATIGINYLGHFLLTYLLRDLLLATVGRVVVVASKAYEYCAITNDMLEGDSPVLFKPVHNPGFEQYAVSNIARVMFARELIKRYPSLTSASLHPGTVDTQVYRSSGLLYRCIASILSHWWKEPEEGARTTLYCATAKLGERNGGYFVNSEFRAINKKQVSDETQVKLWDVSMEIIQKFLKSSEE